MTWLLKNTLVISGVLTLLVLIFPSLIVIGLFFFLVPGVLLALSPTVFFYTSVFTVFWFLLRYIKIKNVYLRLTGTLIATVFLLWFVPLISSNVSKQSIGKLTEQDFLPVKPIQLSGHIILQEGARIECNTLCIAMLLNNKIKSVSFVKESEPKSLINIVEDDIQRTYRILPTERCFDSGQKNVIDGYFKTSFAFKEEIQKRIDDGLCIRASELKLRDHTATISISQDEMSIKDRYGRYLREPNPFQLTAWPIHSDKLTIKDSKGKSLLTTTFAETKILTQLLFVMPSDPSPKVKLGWNRKHISNLIPELTSYGDRMRIDEQKTMLITKNTDIKMSFVK